MKQPAADHQADPTGSAAGSLPIDPHSDCDYYGNRGSNLSVGYCQNRATWDRGRTERVVGLPYKVRYACDEHAHLLIDYRQRSDHNLPSHLDRYHDGLGIYLGTDRNGRPLAYRVYRDRTIRMPRREAERYIAQGEARQLTREQTFGGGR